MLIARLKHHLSAFAYDTHCIVKGESSLECVIFNFRPSVRAIALGHCHAEPRRTEKPRVAAATTRTNEIVAGTMPWSCLLKI